MAERAGRIESLALPKRKLVNPGELEDLGNAKARWGLFQTPIEDVLRSRGVDRTLGTNEQRLRPGVGGQNRQPVREVARHLELKGVIVRGSEVGVNSRYAVVLRISAQGLSQSTVEPRVWKWRKPGVG